MTVPLAFEGYPFCFGIVVPFFGTEQCGACFFWVKKKGWFCFYRVPQVMPFPLFSARVSSNEKGIFC